MKQLAGTIAMALALGLAACGDSAGAPETADPTSGTTGSPTSVATADESTVPSVPGVAGPKIEWTEQPLPEGFRVHALTRAGDRLFGLAFDEMERSDARTRLWVSDDGVTWEAIDVDATRFGMRAGYFRDLAQVGDRYVA